MAMKIGLCFPYTQESLDRDLSLEWFKRVDEGPFSTLSCGERMIGTSVDMMALMGAAAAVTSRVRIVPTLYVLPMHPAVKVAKHAATLDSLPRSDGAQNPEPRIKWAKADGPRPSSTIETRFAAAPLRLLVRSLLRQV